MAVTRADIRPGLFRAGDIGVAAEWRDLTYDWTPLLTPLGVSMYAHCRDTYDQQRALYPFLLSPQGPTKQAMQRTLGLRTGFALQGPEVLLATVGLLHVEVDSYGASADPERPNHTRVAYYVVGRLDHPTLDWPMLDRLLDVLCAACPSETSGSAAADHKRATAALRSLAQAGFLQHCDPGDLFYPLGAWPALLPTLIADPRWAALFTQLHGPVAMQEYRARARAWVEYAGRLAERLRQQNDAIRDQVLAAQRGGPRSGGAVMPPGTAGPLGGPQTTGGGTAARGLVGQTQTATSWPAPQAGQVTESQIPATTASGPATKPAGVSKARSVARESLVSRYPAAVSEAGRATAHSVAQADAELSSASDVANESLATDQLMSRCYWEEKREPSAGATPAGAELRPEPSTDTPLVAAHLRDSELTSTRYDAAFWCEVNRILYGTTERYAHTAGEKKAVERRFKRQEVPVGVVLAALRALMVGGAHQPPGRFGDALLHPQFQAGIQQALALMPAARHAPQDTGSWTSFLQVYRSVGLSAGLRNVSVTDYNVLHGLFQAQPAACWEVLNRVEHAANAPDLSPGYLRRALLNNAQAAIQQAMSRPVPQQTCTPTRAEHTLAPLATGARGPDGDDPRVAVLLQAGLSPNLLQPWMTEGYIQAWLDEATARPNLANVHGWLIWGLGERCWPHEHPTLPPRPAAPAMTAVQRRSSAAAQRPAPAPAPEPRGTTTTAAVWSAVKTAIAAQLPRQEFDTWFTDAALVALTGEQAIVSVPHVFAREALERSYATLIHQSVCTVVGGNRELLIVLQ